MGDGTRGLVVLQAVIELLLKRQDELGRTERVEGKVLLRLGRPSAGDAGDHLGDAVLQCL